MTAVPNKGHAIADAAAQSKWEWFTLEQCD
jgi:hypothetical protein